MNKIIDNFLNSITMYRLMLYFLLVLVAYSAVLAFLGIIPYKGLDILLSSFYIVAICIFSNQLFAKILKAPTNIESPIITGYILGLIFGPVNLFSASIIPLTFIAVVAMASKYFLAIRGRHIFNPAAFGALFGALVLHQGASWWIGSIYTLPVIVLGGILILKKIKRFELVLAFLLASFLPLNTLLESAMIFFAVVMITEPQTSPYKRINQLIYAVVVAVLFNIYGRFMPIPLEAALLTGNIFAYIVNKSFRQNLKLKQIKNESKDVISFLFEPIRPIKFESGQYLEWTLPHPKPDSRGVRRFFTISSSPTENFIMLSTKFAEKSSSFKATLKNMMIGDKISVSNLEGDFILRQAQDEKLCFIAGGIGITPFRSMVKYLVDTKEKRDIILLFSNKTKQDIVFRNLFDNAKVIGLRTVYVNFDKDGFIDEPLIKKEVIDWKERIFYVSGPEPMVEAFEKMLKSMGLPKKQIKTDFFPGYS